MGEGVRVGCGLLHACAAAPTPLPCPIHMPAGGDCGQGHRVRRAAGGLLRHPAGRCAAVHHHRAARHSAGAGRPREGVAPVSRQCGGLLRTCLTSVCRCRPPLRGRVEPRLQGTGLSEQTLLAHLRCSVHNPSHPSAHLLSVAASDLLYVSFLPLFTNKRTNPKQHVIASTSSRSVECFQGSIGRAAVPTLWCRAAAGTSGSALHAASRQGPWTCFLASLPCPQAVSCAASWLSQRQEAPRRGGAAVGTRA